MGSNNRLQEHNDADDAEMLKGSAEILELKGKLQKEIIGNEESKAKLSARNHEISRLSSELANAAADKEALTVHFRNLEGVALVSHFIPSPTLFFFLRSTRLALVNRKVRCFCG